MLTPERSTDNADPGRDPQRLCEAVERSEAHLEPGMITDHYEVKLEILDDATCWRLLVRAAFGRVAFFHADELHVLPVNAAVKAEKVIFRVPAGSLIAKAGHGAMVAFESDEIDRSAESGWSVLVRGSLWDVTDTPAATAWHELTVRSWAPGPLGRWMCIEPTAVTGRILSRQRILNRLGDLGDASPSTHRSD
jgi:nitroimidazol reductase NimA-like FMN-containing flavoprotein (pyridoxamine 5'-phosphate oxidase superfamily)